MANASPTFRNWPSVAATSVANSPFTVVATIFRRLSTRANASDKMLMLLSKFSSIVYLLARQCSPRFDSFLRNGELYINRVTISFTHELPDGGFVCYNASGTDHPFWIDQVPEWIDPCAVQPGGHIAAYAADSDRGCSKCVNCTNLGRFSAGHYQHTHRLF